MALLRNWGGLMSHQTELDHGMPDQTWQASNAQIAAAKEQWVLAHQVNMTPSCRDEWHEHDWYQLMYASDGVLNAHTRQRALVVPPQRAVWIPPHTEHSAYALNGAKFRSLYFHPHKQPLCLGTESRVLAVTPLIRELILAVVARCRVPEQWGAADDRMTQVLLHQLSVQPDIPLTIVTPQDARLKPLVEALQHNPGDETSLLEWSQRLGLSSRTLARSFTRETGLGFREWRQKLRLLHSLDLLESGVSVTQAALEVGYQSPSAFIQSFKHAFGATPKEYMA